jgi:hypothetical protein
VAGKAHPEVAARAFDTVEQQLQAIPDVHDVGATLGVSGWRSRILAARPALDRYAPPVVLTLGLALCGANIVRYQARAWDDAFISFRFASHLASGEGLVWNVHGEHVEGYTSMLHVALLAAAARAGLDLESFALALSVAATVATAGILLWLLRRADGSIPLAAALPVALYLADDATAIHATSRLETPLFLLLLAVDLLIASRLVRAPRTGTAALLAVTTFLTILCRPEGALYAAVLYIALLIYSSRRSLDLTLESVRRGVLLSGAVAAGLIAAYAAWKYAYFGYLLPNPFYVKSNRLSWVGWPEVKSFLEHVAWRIGVPMLVMVTISVPSARVIAELRKSLWPILVLLALATVGLLYYATIVHETGGAHRFSFPTIIYLTLTAGYFGRALELRRQTKPRLILASAAAWMLMLQPTFAIHPLPRGEFNDYHWRIAEALRGTHLGAHATVLSDAAGVIPYVSGFNQIDRVGLTDNYLSGCTPHRLAEREAYMWAAAPQVYIGYEPPATVGCNAPDVDAIMRTPYVARVLLKRPLLALEDRIFLQDAALLHQRMRELRDHWDWVGEIEWPGWGLWHLKSFAYVRKDASPSLHAAVNTLVARHPAEVVLDNIPQ